MPECHRVGAVGAGDAATSSRYADSLSRTHHRGTKSLVDLVGGIGGNQYTLAANIEDRTPMTYLPLLGRAVLQTHRLDVSRRVEEHVETMDEE